MVAKVKGSLSHQETYTAVLPLKALNKSKELKFVTAALQRGKLWYKWLTPFKLMASYKGHTHYALMKTQAVQALNLEKATRWNRNGSVAFKIVAVSFFDSR